jgi:hypothetical protein
MRVFLVLALLANLGFFAWARGWLEPMWPAPVHGEREPARVAAQVRPEAIAVLSAKAASTAVSAARAASMAAGEAELCVEAGPFAAAEVAAAESLLVQAGVPRETWEAQPRSVEGVPSTWLRIERANVALREQLRGIKLGAAQLAFSPCR